MLPDASYQPSLPCSDLARAKKFYADKLGLTLADEQPGGAIYEGVTGPGSSCSPAATAHPARAAGWLHGHRHPG